MTSATIGGQATPARLRRSRHFHGQVIIGVIGLSALAGLCPGKPGSRPRMPGRLGRRRALRDIARDLADSDPPLDELFFSFTQLASDVCPTSPAESKSTAPNTCEVPKGKAIGPNPSLARCPFRAHLVCSP